MVWRVLVLLVAAVVPHAVEALNPLVLGLVSSVVGSIDGASCLVVDRLAHSMGNNMVNHTPKISLGTNELHLLQLLGGAEHVVFSRTMAAWVVPLMWPCAARRSRATSSVVLSIRWATTRSPSMWAPATSICSLLGVLSM